QQKNNNHYNGSALLIVIQTERTQQILLSNFTQVPLQPMGLKTEFIPRITIRSEPVILLSNQQKNKGEIESENIA
ncbi:MAG TPA: hypothetical protein PLT13_17415, partial [Spirochaetota bacterium]|nr:hypothetical protein [Spirochaetota bacterium]